MTELIKNAWLGWQTYTDHGKLPALLLAALLFVWLGRRYREHKTFFLYAAVVTVCCIFPLTAALLMLYQTRFYDYQWIWSLVPMTPVIAYGISEFLTDAAGGTREKITAGFAGLCASAIAVIFLCGGLGEEIWDVREDSEARAGCVEVLAAVRDRADQDNVCLWAPREIMEYARTFDENIRLVYGRNMWDQALNAYSYDVYAQKTRDLYLQMCSLEDTGTFTAPSETTADPEGAQDAAVPWEPEAVFGSALAQDVSCIVLPGDTEPEILSRAQDFFDTEAFEVRDYYVMIP